MYGKLRMATATAPTLEERIRYAASVSRLTNHRAHMRGGRITSSGEGVQCGESPHLVRVHHPNNHLVRRCIVG
jgi:hypothetical protein